MNSNIFTLRKTNILEIVFVLVNPIVIKKKLIAELSGIGMY